MKKIKLFIQIAAVLFLFTALAFTQTNSLFKIERSKNANIVQYDANLDAAGQINVKKPIDYYWLLHASDGSREEITTFQKKAYGFSVKYNEAGYFDMQMKAVEDRKLKVSLIDGEPKAEILINGKNAYLSKIYIDSTDNFMGIPKVNYYTLTGNDIETGDEVEEKVAVKN
ncbi:MAG: DUF4833 domain-containing protein [Endomicrobium sp.]|jgi:hypothetical protein|nr:DUF4833 domain-containing protein [Endomicrobium sp.]